MKQILILAFGCALLLGCTEQQRAKQFGGSTSTALPCGHKLEMITWKDANLWILTRPMRAGEEPETHTFSESSNLGFAEGKITVTESRCR